MKEGLTAQVVGFRYFNVYGQQEQHKGRMASVLHHFHQYREHGYVNLFGANDGYGNGEQTRDFVSVEDVAKVNLYFFDHPELSGILTSVQAAANSLTNLPPLPSTPAVRPKASLK